jgi:Zn-finger nucleic acid-binding protein
MKCPVCKDTLLQNQDLLQNLAAKTCHKCGGHWIQSFQYWKWLDKHAEAVPEKPREDARPLPVSDSKAGKTCPECGHFLTHKKVGRGVDFCLDRCNSCGGIWFDKNEWETLVSKNLHDQVHFVFSAAWQKQLFEQESRETYEARIREILGTADYDRLEGVVQWIHDHPHKDTILGCIEQAGR